MTAALDVLHGLVLDDGRRWGEAAAGSVWQAADAEAVLEPAGDAPRLHWLGRPKGGSKSTDLAGISIAWLLEQAPAGAEGFAVAADLEQANRLLDKARGFISRTPGLSGVLRVDAQRIVNLRTGARVQALAADVAGSEGLLSPWFVVDELPNWASTAAAKAMWVSIFSAVPKVAGCRLVVIGHAGDPAHWSHKILERARSSPAWHVDEVPGPLPWISSSDLEEQRAVLTESAFQRRHLNIWVAGDERLTTREDVLACVTLDGPLRPVAGVDYVVALDVGMKKDRTVAAVCHVEPWGVPGRRAASTSSLAEDEHLAALEAEAERTRRLRIEMSAGGSVFDFASEREQRRRPSDALLPDARGVRVVLDRMMVWSGTQRDPVSLREVEAWLLAASRTFNGAPIVADPWQAMHSLEQLRADGVRAEEFIFSQTSVSRLAGVLFQLLRNHALALPNDEDLVDELVNVRLIETAAGMLRLDHEAGAHDDRAVALALAAHQLLSRPARSSIEVVRTVDERLSTGRRAR